MDTNAPPEVEYDVYVAQKKAFYSSIYTPKALQEDFSSLSNFATDFSAYNQEKLGLELVQHHQPKKGSWDYGAVICLAVKFYQHKKSTSLYLGTILDKINGKKVRTFWANLHPSSTKKEGFYAEQAETFTEILEKFQDYVLINRLVRTNKKYFEINGKAVPVGSVLLLGKKFLVHPLLLSESDILPDYGDWADARHWTMMANMPLRIKLRKLPVQTLKAEADRIAHLVGRSKSHESLQISIYYEQFDAINTTIHFLLSDEDLQKFRIREENKLKKRLKTKKIR